LIGGVLVAFLPLPALLLFDALSYLLSAASLALITRSFNATTAPHQASTTLRTDLLEGLRYAWRQPVIRMTTLMIGLVNVVSITANAQLVLFAKRWIAASDPQVGWLYAAGGIGAVLCALAAGPLQKRWSASKLMLGALMLEGLPITALTFSHSYWAALLLWALSSGMGTLFGITSLSLVQRIVPNELLGRVRSVVRVLAWSAIPIGSLLGGLAIQQTQNIGLVYAVSGLLAFLIPVAFAFTSLGHAERSLPAADEPSTLVEERATS
jgi:predicted MFS family arabinose efflux permease